MVEKPTVLKDTITQYQELYKLEQFKEQAATLAKIGDNDSNSKMSSIYDELTKLNDLKEKGIISEEEFQKTKEKILSK